MSTDDEPLLPDHEYQIVTSDSPISVDGYALGEPKAVECYFCNASMYITPQRSPGVWSLNHEKWCPNAEEE